MQNKNNNIDDLFKKGLNNVEIAPPAAVWDRVAETMGHRKRKRRALFIWSFSGAASILLAFLLGWNLSNSEQVVSDDLYAELAVLQANLKTKVILESKIEQNVELKLLRPELIQPSLSKRIVREHSPEPIAEEVEPMGILNSASVLLEQFSFQDAQLQAVNDVLFSESDRAIIENNLLALNTEETADKAFTKASSDSKQKNNLKKSAPTPISSSDAQEAGQTLQA